MINKVILPVDGDGSSTSVKRRASQCESCGYIHPLKDEPGPDLCESCGSKLPPAYDNLFRMQNVATRRRDRINSDEEERFRLGYELKTGLRFARRGGIVSARSAEVVGSDGESLATLIARTPYVLTLRASPWIRLQSPLPPSSPSPRLGRTSTYHR